MNDKIATTDSPDGEFFFGCLRDICGMGTLLKRLDDDTKRVISEVLRTGNPGKVQLTLSVKKCGEERQILIKPDVKRTVPTSTVRDRLLYADETGRLFTDDPAQGVFNFADAPQKVSKSNY